MIVGVYWKDMEGHRNLNMFGLCDHLSSCMTWRCLETSGILSFSLVSAEYLVYIRAHRPQWKHNANCLVYSNNSTISRETKSRIELQVWILSRAVVKPDLHRVQGVSIPPLFVLMQDVVDLMPNLFDRGGRRWCLPPLFTSHEDALLKLALLIKLGSRIYTVLAEFGTLSKQLSSDARVTNCVV